MAEEMTIVGTRDVDFTDKQGRHISGLSLFINRVEKGVNGLLAERLFINSEVLATSNYVPKAGDTITIIWGRNNRILGVQRVKANG